MESFSRIIATASYLPTLRLTNFDLEKMVETSHDWIITRTGIEERRLAASDETASDMGFAAAEKLFLKSGLDPQKIDLVIVATLTPDYRTPSTACILQDRLGLRSVPAFDLHAACSGYLYGLATAKAFIESGAYKNILLIASEKLSSIVNYKDRNTCVLFGDGASATWVTGEDLPGLSIGQPVLGSDGSKGMLLSIPAGGSKRPFDEEVLEEGAHFLAMHGNGLFKDAVRRMCMAAEEALLLNSLACEKIDWLLPHQANLRIIEAVAERMKIPMERVHLSLQKYGNTSAASIPIGLDEMLSEGQIKPGQTVLAVAFGAGLTWGAIPLYDNRRPS